MDEHCHHHPHHFIAVYTLRSLQTQVSLSNILELLDVLRCSDLSTPVNFPNVKLKKKGSLY